MKEAFIAIGGLERVSIGAQPIPAWQRHRADQSTGNTLKDVHALQRSAPLIKWVTPEMSSLSPVTMTRGDKAYNPFESKNNSVHIPLNTMKLRFRANASATGTPEERLASITERVREIGIRKAIGATFLGVFIQVLAESVVIAALGGLVGLLASQGLVNLLSLLSPADFTPVITAQAMALAFSFSVGVGILAGLFPGFKAARLSPIQALRYE